MQISGTALRDVKLLRPKIHTDERGWFAEMFSAKAFREAGLPHEFVQENQSSSARGVLRGLHYQLGQPQGKLVRVLAGHVWDVAVDLRRDSPDFGKWAGFHLEPQTVEMLWIPEGFAHGFLVISDTADVQYKTTRGYFPEGERCIRWDDAELGIAWPLEGIVPVVSGKDSAGKKLAEAELP